MKPKIILYIATTVDGFIARKDGSIDFLKPYEGKREDYGYKKFYNSVDTIVMGNNTYKQVLTFGEYPYKGKKCSVLTRNKSKKSDGNVEFVNSVKQVMTKNKSKRIWLVGGSQIIQEFLKKGLVDEFIISYIPILLGEGIPLFANSKNEQKLILISSKKYKSGIVQTHYKIKM